MVGIARRPIPSIRLPWSGLGRPWTSVPSWTSLGQGHDADEAAKPGHWRHLDRSAMRIWTPILALQQVRLEGVGHAAPSSWHVITAGMTKGWCDGPDPSFRPCRVRATPARLFGSQLDDVDQ